MSKSTTAKTSDERHDFKLSMFIGGQEKVVFQENDSSLASIAGFEAILFHAFAAAAARQARGEDHLPL